MQPVGIVTTDDIQANIWPQEKDVEVRRAHDRAFAETHGVKGVLNVFFCKQMETSTAYAWVGGGPAFIGENGGDLLSNIDFLQLVAHELGHALCLRHVCPNSDEEAAKTFFGTDCEDGHEDFLMYPYWNKSDSMILPPGQIDGARIGASGFERGKTKTSGPLGGISCGAPDTSN